jgi:hypothetical protein
MQPTAIPGINQHPAHNQYSLTLLPGLRRNVAGEISRHADLLDTRRKSYVAGLEHKRGSPSSSSRRTIVPIPSAVREDQQVGRDAEVIGRRAKTLWVPAGGLEDFRISRLLALLDSSLDLVARKD